VLGCHRDMQRELRAGRIMYATFKLDPSGIHARCGPPRPCELMPCVSAAMIKALDAQHGDALVAFSGAQQPPPPEVDSGAGHRPSPPPDPETREASFPMRAGKQDFPAARAWADECDGLYRAAGLLLPTRRIFGVPLSLVERTDLTLQEELDAQDGLERLGPDGEIPDEEIP